MRAAIPRPSRAAPSLAFIGLPRRKLEHRRFTLTEVRDDASATVGRHLHDTPHLCLILSEGYRSSARGAGALCGRGTLLVHPAGTVHEDRFERRGGSFLSLHPCPEGEDDPEPARLPSTSVAFLGPRVERLCERLLLESTGRDDCSPLALECLFYELMAIASEAPASRHTPSWLSPALAWVRDSEKVPGVAELARFAGVHPVSFARTFRHHQGVSPGEFLRWTRIERVLPFLRNRRTSLAEVALEAGFSDQSALTRACRRVLGVTPGEYRRRLSS